MLLPCAVGLLVALLFACPGALFRPLAACFAVAATWLEAHS